MNKKKLIIIIVVIIVLLAIILPLSLISHKEVDTSNLESVLLKEYSDVNLRTIDKDEIRDYFGLEIDDDKKALFMTDFQNEDSQKPFSPNMLIVIVNDSDYQEIADALKSYIDSEINNVEDYERIKLYQEANIQAKSNYYYLVISNDNNVVKIIEKYIK